MDYDDIDFLGHAGHILSVFVLGDGCAVLRSLRTLLQIYRTHYDIPKRNTFEFIMLNKNRKARQPNLTTFKWKINFRFMRTE